jgi:hypothetical protein
MESVQNVLRTHPRSGAADIGQAGQTALAIFECAAACVACADACLGEDQLQNLRRCIRTCLDCGDVCALTGRLVLRHTETVPSMVRAQLEACVTACRVCAEECERHAGMHEHCRYCGESCRRCEGACRQLLGSLAA